MNNRIVVTALIVLSAAAFAVRPAHAQDRDPRIDAIFAPWDGSGIPGCALGVVRDGRPLYQRGYGIADLDHGIPNAPAMVYYVGSVSKQFTAASIALLAADGRISLDDDARKYVPELPDYGRPITIRHLVHHTSGLRDIYVLMDLAGIRMEDVLTDEDALALITRQRELNFMPGDDYLYSNSGYWLLGQIVERVSGQSMREYARTRIFEPLGMTETHFHDEPGHPIRNRVTSYAPAGDDYRISYLPNFDKIGAGGLYTTIGDLMKWDSNFYDPRVGGNAFLDQIHTRGILNSGDTLAYAFGLTIGTHRGLRTVRHGGSLMGFRAEFLRFPDQRLSVITLCNLGTINPGPLAERVAAVYLGDLMQPVVAAAAIGAGGRGAERPQQPTWSPSADALDAFAGSFHSEEVDATWTIRREGDALFVTRPITGRVRLAPIAPDAFRGNTLGLSFARNGAGVITGFTVEAGRVRNIGFTRTN